VRDAVVCAPPGANACFGEVLAELLFVSPFAACTGCVPPVCLSVLLPLMLLLQVTFLASLPAMKGLGQQYLRALSHCFHTVNFEPREVVVRQGDVADCMYVIKSGQVCILIDPSMTLAEGAGAEGSSRDDRSAGAREAGAGGNEIDTKKLVQVRQDVACIALYKAVEPAGLVLSATVCKCLVQARPAPTRQAGRNQTACPGLNALVHHGACRCACWVVAPSSETCRCVRLAAPHPGALRLLLRSLSL
jgi:hypothetical protein